MQLTFSPNLRRTLFSFACFLVQRAWKKNTPSPILVYFILQPLLNLLSCLSCGCARTRIRVRHVPTGVEYSGQTDKKLIRIGKQE